MPPQIFVKRFSRDKRIEAPAVAAPAAVEETVNTSIVPVEASQDDDFSCLGRSAYENELAEAAEQVQRLADEKERQKLEKELERERLAEEKRQRAASKKCAVVSKRKVADDDDSIFGDTGTEIIGKERRILLQKTHQYKQLFPTELKSFKVKRNANTEELKAYIDEMSAIVEVSSIDEFLTDSILSCVKLVEGVSSYTQNYNLSDLADMLRVNPQFNKLCKQLYLKYGSLDNCPPEYQMVLLVATTSYICIDKNKNKAQFNSYLNSPHTS